MTDFRVAKVFKKGMIMRVGMKVIVTMIFTSAFIYIGLNMMSGLGEQVANNIIK